MRVRASEFRGPSAVGPEPDATGFITATRRPRATSARVRAAEMRVLPTPVSVPVTKKLAAVMFWARSCQDFLSSSDVGRRNPDFAAVHGCCRSSGATPCSAVDDLVCRRQPAVLAERLVGSEDSLQPVTADEGTGAAGSGVSGAYGFEVAHDRHGVTVGELGAVDVQHGFLQAGADQRVTDVVHVEEAVDVIVSVGFRPGAAQLLQSVGAEGGEGEEALRLQDAADFGEDFLQRVAPLQHEIAEDDVDTSGFER